MTIYYVVSSMDSIRDDIIFDARLKLWTDELENSIGNEWEYSVSFLKKIYESFDSMPKPSTPKQAEVILKFIDVCLKWVDVAYSNAKQEEDSGVFNVCKLCRSLTKVLRAYIDDETKVNDALTAVLTVRRGSDERINAIVFNEDDLYLMEHDETGGGEVKNDENAKLKIIEIFHTLNNFTKNAFDKIHDAHRVKRLFK